MKKLFILILLLISLGLELSSCKKSNENTNTPSNGGNEYPCDGDSVLIYEGQVYHTIEIGSQCWMKENLNVGIMIIGTQPQNDNSTIEKYCIDNNLANCDTFGGLYQWGELMQYQTVEHAQGICPEGWHIPSDADWKVLEGIVDTLHGLGSSEWNNLGFRGEDAGENLKSTSGWFNNGNGTDTFGFSAIPSGYRDNHGYIFQNYDYSGFWLSSEYNSDTAMYRSLVGYNSKICRGYWRKVDGFSVRCIKD